MIKFTIKLVILFLCFSSLVGCGGRDTVQIEKEEQEQKEFNLKYQKLEDARIDTLNQYIGKADNQFKIKKYSEGVLFLDTACKFANVVEKNDIIARRATVLVDLKRYKDAINDYSLLIAKKVKEKDNYFLRAVCFKKIRKTQRAVDDLVQAISLGNADAEILHNKINPIRKRIAYYETLCCDGTTSDAKGRGACSHHGGVCDWNNPVYEEYRKY